MESDDVVIADIVGQALDIFLCVCGGGGGGEGAGGVYQAHSPYDIYMK